MPQYHINTISVSTFKDALSRYSSLVPEKLRDLDALRYTTVPSQVIEKDGSTNLTKDKAEKLVEWKLKHGTFRPKLLALVQSNDADTVSEITTKASELLKSSNESPLPALKVLTQLRGIGPATASLLLSVLAPAAVPFFSDELFRWSCWDEAGAGGWKRSIKYNAKEYGMLVERVGVLRKRLGGDVQAVDVERVAWVLGKEGVDVDAGDENAGEDGAGQVKGGSEAEVEEGKLVDKNGAKKRKIEDEDVAKAPQRKVVKKVTPRKVKEVNPPTVGARKSTRAKK